MSYRPYSYWTFNDFARLVADYDGERAVLRDALAELQMRQVGSRPRYQALIREIESLLGESDENVADDSDLEAEGERQSFQVEALFEPGLRFWLESHHVSVDSLDESGYGEL